MRIPVRINAVEKMARNGDVAFFLLTSGDRVRVPIMDIAHDRYTNGTHRGMIIEGKSIPTTVVEMQLVNIWKNMLQGN